MIILYQSMMSTSKLLLTVNMKGLITIKSNTIGSSQVQFQQMALNKS